MASAWRYSSRTGPPLLPYGGPGSEREQLPVNALEFREVMLSLPLEFLNGLRAQGVQLLQSIQGKLLTAAAPPRSPFTLRGLARFDIADLTIHQHQLALQDSLQCGEFVDLLLSIAGHPLPLFQPPPLKASNQDFSEISLFCRAIAHPTFGGTRSTRWHLGQLYSFPQAKRA